GLVLTNPVNGLVTCSAAAGTAIASGRKTRMNMVGVDSVGQPLESVLTFASKRGMKTAVVSDASITDATPAAFFGHVVNRENEETLAMQLAVGNNIDVILGGGASLFIPQNKSYKDFEEFINFPGDFNQFSGRSDSLNLIVSFQEKGYSVACSKKEMEEAPLDKKLIGLFAAGGLPSPINRDSATKNIPTVSQMAQKAFTMISKAPNGYFSMIECAQIDWEAHSNDAGGVYKAVIEMNDILKVAYDYYSKNPQKTLLIFTADHETGGLSIAYTKVEGNEIEKYTVSNGETWMNNTNPLSFNDYKKLPLQKMSVGRILDMSKSSEQFRLNVRKYTGYEITSYEADEIYKSYLDLHKNIRIK
ncbi:MAG TPA: alkaline phosphatase, partial [Bacteroidales bacterium]|nr:alkaline phosphatase [Bacteroidales bacterium]